MTILEVFRKKKNEFTSEEDEHICSKLFDLAKDIEKDASEHLKLIVSQLPNFDNHDSNHSKKVLENMEALMGEKVILGLSFYELFLLYLSAYLHDCAMALPIWELRLLQNTEGHKDIKLLEYKNSIKHDNKPPFKTSEAKQYINDKYIELYGIFNDAKEFIFCNIDEKEFRRDLCERLISYQEFRNGYSDELIEYMSDDDKYKMVSDEIRYEYIRSTHPQRVEKYIQNLAPMFEKRLGGAWGIALANDLAKICRSHGEDYDYIKNMEKNLQVSYLGCQTANLQFISILLRLGDVIHFSYDRASRSLFAEKLIESEESRKHWKIKYKGLNYDLSEIDDNARVKIKYTDYCEEPSYYYFIQSYFDLVDEEINNYFKFIHGLQYCRDTQKLVNRYELSISEKVDRDHIRYNKQKFEPVSNMRFTLNQKKILNLLMGVNLYKDKFLCIRELYQNSLDACRCMISIYSSNPNIYNFKGKIEFGIGESVIDNKKMKYIYCQDNGIGMTKEIIEKFFLKIGNSYYNSREFKRKSVKWKNSFKATSQFGIGVLSCFMIGDKIEIITRAADDCEKRFETVRFFIDGPHERFYYLTAEEMEIEKIGSHGTIVRIYLNDNEKNKINCDFFENLELLFDHNYWRDTELYKTWQNNLYRILLFNIGIVNESIDLEVICSNDKKLSLIPWNKTIEYYSPSDQEEDNYKKYISCKEFIDHKDLKVVCEDTEYYFSLSLPKPEIPMLSLISLLIADNTVHRLIDGVITKVLVDGVRVKEFSLSDSRLDKSKFRNIELYGGIINFIGNNRPQLSVDRNNVTEISKKIIEDLPKKLINEICGKIVDIMKEYFNKYKFTFESEVYNFTWEYIAIKFRGIIQQLIDSIIKTKDVDFSPKDLGHYLSDSLSIKDIIRGSEVKFRNIDIRNLTYLSKQILTRKSVTAKTITVSNSDIIIESDFDKDEKISDTIYAIATDTWEGRYKEYDFVTNLLPFVPEKLYNTLHIEMRTFFNENQIDYSNNVTLGKRAISIDIGSITEIWDLDPLLIHPKLGIFSRGSYNCWDNDYMSSEENSLYKFYDSFNCSISVSDIICGLNGFYDKSNFLSDIDKRYAIFFYVPPRNLNSNEKQYLDYYKTNDPEYFEGIINGWSILLIGDVPKKVIVPGILKRDKMINIAKDSSFYTNIKNEFRFADGTVLSFK